MKTADPRCFHPDGLVHTPPRRAEIEEQARAKVADRLRCASKLGCTDAVRCSDDAMTALRALLGKAR